jgi:molybdopterin-binding protein
MTMCRALLVPVAAALAAMSAPSIDLDAQVSVPGQVTPARPAVPGAVIAKGTAVMKGTVVAMDTGTPLRRVQVRVFAAAAQDSRVATTDDQGRFELRELVGGRYTITASKGGFVTLQYGQRRPSERGTPVEIGDGQVLENVKMALPRGSVIASRITDDAGEPLTGAQVQAMRYTFAQGGRRLMPVGTGANRTDDQGAFRLFGLPPGDYYLFASMPPSMGMPGGAAATEEQGFAPTYYPGTPSRSDAERVTVGVGQELTGLLFGLTPTRLSRITGRVIGPPGSTSGFLMAMPDDGMIGVGMSGRPIESDGTFELPGVAPGRYILQVQPRGRGDDELVGRAAITVAGADLANVTITMQRQGTLSGRVEFEGGVPAELRASQGRVSLQPVDPTGYRFGGPPPEVADDFTFVARGSMGPAYVRLFGYPGWNLKTVEINGQDVTDTPVPLEAGQSISGARILLSRASTTLSGSVRDDRGQVVLDATVLVFPADESKWTYMSRYIRTARPDTQGRFEITGLPPSAAYRIVSVPAIEDGQANDPEFLSSVRDRAERLSLNEGETKTVDLRLSP